MLVSEKILKKLANGSDVRGVAVEGVPDEPVTLSVEAANVIASGFLEFLAEKTGKEALEVFEAALENIMPVLEVKARRVGGATYQVPMEVKPERRQTLGLRWLTAYSRARSEKTMKEKLAAEIIDASNGVGGACKKRDDTHKMAEANKAFAHYRW